MKIYLARHGETDWNTQGLWQGSINVPLNANGRSQAYEVANKLFQKPGINVVDCVFSSPLQRAKETAEIISSVLNTRVIVNNDLREVELGDWEGKHNDVVVSSTGFKKWEDGEMQAPGGGESKRQVYVRAVRAINNLVERESQDLIIATHTLVIRVIINYILGLPIGDWGTYRIDNGAITTISYNPKTQHFQIITLNEL